MLAQIGYQQAMGSGTSTRFRKTYEEWAEITTESLVVSSISIFAQKK
jgi:hypothetical protein